ncbi:hypothetical protein C1H76_1337 [Elsinoe australis]|uniref:Uncharacterized protein n=1 Tax=Elsinoe australis TaxID=40998 RepID=A0A4U7B917_9PEZI|nr:hypothetical protein C1H76_1337 [Elsinoe australis]
MWPSIDNQDELLCIARVNSAPQPFVLSMVGQTCQYSPGRRQTMRAWFMNIQLRGTGVPWCHDGTYRYYIPLSTAGVRFPPSVTFFRDPYNVYIKMWNDGKIMAGKYMMSESGTEHFFFSIAVVPVHLHNWEELHTQNIRDEYPEVQFSTWFVAHGRGTLSKTTFANVVFGRVEAQRYEYFGSA